MAKHDLCSSCYREGKFANPYNSSDYTKLENEKYTSIADRDAPWSDTEMLLLLEGLELYDDNWDSVAEHVGTRTREECVLKFLQLEIEDKYLEGEPESDYKNNQAYLGNGRIPFSQADNPVMSVMGFLAGLADPAVAAAAAGRSVEEMKKHLQSKLDKESTAEVTEVSQDKETENDQTDHANAAVKDEGRMDVDQPAMSREVAKAESTDPATLALSLTAARAAALASHTERHLTSLVSSAVNLQLQKMELKLQQFTEMETLLAAERRELERQRQRLFLDRLAFRKRVRETEEKLKNMKVGGGESAQNGVEEERLGLTKANGEAAQSDVQPPSQGEPGYAMHEV